MRHGFENQLHQFNEIAKDLSAPELPDETRKRLNDVLDWHIGKAAERFRTPQETQRFVFEMQEKKRQVMERLKNRLRQIDNPFQEREPDSRPVTFENGGFVCEFKGKPVPITQGEILTDVEWGLDYALDPLTVPKTLRKRYWVEVAKRDLTRLLNEQISESEIQAERPGWDLGKVNAYKELRNWEDKNNRSISGQYAEREIRNFLRKLAIDSGANFRVIQGDAHQDVEMKIDFVLIVPNKVRGVSVDKQERLQKNETENLRMGIQFTINADQERINKKNTQISKSKARLAPMDKIDDIVFVKMSLKHNWLDVNKWLQDGKPPGGPEKNWSNDRKAHAIESLLEKFLTVEEVAALTKIYKKVKKKERKKKTKKYPIQPTIPGQDKTTSQEKTTNTEIRPREHGTLQVGQIIESAKFTRQEDGKTFLATNENGQRVVLAPGLFPRANVAYRVRMAMDRNKKSPTYGELVGYIEGKQNKKKKKTAQLNPPSSPAP